MIKLGRQMLKPTNDKRNETYNHLGYYNQNKEYFLNITEYQ